MSRRLKGVPMTTIWKRWAIFTGGLIAERVDVEAIVQIGSQDWGGGEVVQDCGKSSPGLFVLPRPGDERWNLNLIHEELG